MAVESNLADLRSGWRKSSHSGGEGNCVEVAQPCTDSMAVRDSKDPRGPVLAFAADAWQAFVAEVKNGGLQG